MCTEKQNDKTAKSAENNSAGKQAANYSSYQKEPTYCLTFGKREIYGVTRRQIQDLYHKTGLFIEREKDPFAYPVYDYDKKPTGVEKMIELCDDYGSNCFIVTYGLTAYWYPADCFLRRLSVAQMKRLAETILEFLRVFGENGERKVSWKATDYPVEELPPAFFRIKEDRRQADIDLAAKVYKYIVRMEGNETKIVYQLEVNELDSTELSFGEFLAVHRQLGEFLKETIKCND